MYGDKAEYCDKYTTTVLWVHLTGKVSHVLPIQLFAYFLSTKIHSDTPVNYNHLN